MKLRQGLRLDIEPKRFVTFYVSLKTLRKENMEMEKRMIGFRPDENTEKIITLTKEMGSTLKEEVARLKARGMDSEAIVYDLYLEAFDRRFRERCHALMNNTKGKPGIGLAELCKLMYDWEASPRKK
jgi:hypothetical protein